MHCKVKFFNAMDDADAVMKPWEHSSGVLFQKLQVASWNSSSTYRIRCVLLFNIVGLKMLLNKSRLTNTETGSFPREMAIPF